MEPGGEGFVEPLANEERDVAEEVSSSQLATTVAWKRAAQKGAHGSEKRFLSAISFIMGSASRSHRTNVGCLRTKGNPFLIGASF